MIESDPERLAMVLTLRLRSGSIPLSPPSVALKRVADASRLLTRSWRDNASDAVLAETANASGRYARSSKVPNGTCLASVRRPISGSTRPTPCSTQSVLGIASYVAPMALTEDSIVVAA
ncbi:MAG: hypothetical protein H6519_08760 [Microthrixaceae bacterium]|nr:hypothetical protein [Microthrixaceae bacterium]